MDEALRKALPDLQFEANTKLSRISHPVVEKIFLNEKKWSQNRSRSDSIAQVPHGDPGSRRNHQWRVAARAADIGLRRRGLRQDAARGGIPRARGGAI